MLLIKLRPLARGELGLEKMKKGDLVLLRSSSLAAPVQLRFLEVRGDYLILGAGNQLAKDLLPGQGVYLSWQQEDFLGLVEATRPICLG